MIDLIKDKYPLARAFKSVCDASTKRQEALLSLPKEVELIYIVGGRNSNNAKTLFDMASLNYPNALVRLIQNEDDINEKDIKDKYHIIDDNSESDAYWVDVDEFKNNKKIKRASSGKYAQKYIF